jgi:DNA topoisomerase IB
VRRGRGFIYLDENGEPIREQEVIERLGALAIPPAWRDVWICPDPLGHLQATGIDAAGRKQYLYHSRWREHRDREKFERMVRFAQALPRLRRRVLVDLRGDEPTRERVLGLAARLLDVGLFRIGNEEYADEEGGIGLTTLHRSHVSVHGDQMVFDYPAKGGVRRVQAIDDPLSLPLVRALRRRRGDPPELMAFRERRRWSRLKSDDVNEYLKQHMGEDFSAKDFRTWNGTVLAAVSLAADSSRPGSTSRRRRVINRAVKAVAELLGNTPAVARRAYIDPRVFDRYLSGWTIAPALERIGDLDVANDQVRARLEAAVLDLLADQEDSPALQQQAAA